MPPVEVLADAHPALDPVGVGVADRVHPEAGVAFPAESPFRDRVLHQVGHVDDQQRLVVGGASIEVVDDPAAKVALQFLVAQPQVNQQRLAHQIVQRHAIPDRLGHGQLAQLLVGRIALAARKHRSEQVRGRVPGDRGDAQRGHPHVFQLSVSEPVDQRPENLRALQVGLGVPGRVGAGGVGRERESQR